MKKNEVSDLMRKIKSQRQEFIVDDFKVNDWYEILKEYDSEDVEEKLDKFFSNEYNDGKIPTAYFLIRNLYKKDEKGRVINRLLFCKICGGTINENEYDKHYTKCSEVSSIIRDMKKYYSTDLDFEDLINYSDEKLEKTYQKYVELMIQSPLVPDFRKKIFLRILYPDTEININELLKDMVSGLNGV